MSDEDLAEIAVEFPLSTEYGTPRERRLLENAEAALSRQIERSGAGVWVAHETGGSTFTVYFEGRDAALRQSAMTDPVTEAA